MVVLHAIIKGSIDFHNSHLGMNVCLSIVWCDWMSMWSIIDVEYEKKGIK